MMESVENTPDIDIYRPDLIKTKSLGLGQKQTGYSSLLQDAQENGMIPVKLEEEVVRQRISRDLYEKPSSGLRELFANEIRACHTAKDKHGANPRIEITINDNPLSRKLSIQGCDSMGISEKLFLDVARYLGRSDNFSGNEPGQFGFGLASYTCLSDVMILETYSRQTGEQFAVMGKNGIGFEILPKPNLEKYGTKITMTLRNNVSFTDLVKKLEKFAMFGGIDVFLIIEGDSALRGMNYVTGINPMVRMTFDQKVACEASTHDDYTTVLSMPIEIREEDYELYGRFTFTYYHRDKDSPIVLDSMIFRHGWDAHETFLLGLPIEAKINLPFSHSILNIRDERKYKPTPDRERISEDAVKVLEKKIMQKLSECLRDGEIQNMAEFKTHKYYLLYKNRKDVLDGCNVLSESATDLLDFLDTDIVMDTGRKTKISTIIDSNVKLVKLHSLRSEKVGALRKAIPNATIFRFVPGDNPDAEARLARIKCKVINGDEYIVKKNIKTKRDDMGAKEVLARYMDWGKRNISPYGSLQRKTVLSNELEDYMIRVSQTQAVKIHDMMCRVKSTYLTVREHKRLVGGITYDDFIRNAENLPVQTNNGIMTVKKIIKCGHPIYIAKYGSPDVLRQIKFGDSLIILHDGDELFQIMACLNEHKIQYRYEKGRGSMDHFWEALGMKRFVSADNVSSSYSEDKSIVDIMIKISSYANTIKDEHLSQLFVYAASGMDDKDDMDAVYANALQLDKKIDGLEEKANTNTSRC